MAISRRNLIGGGAALAGVGAIAAATDRGGEAFAADLTAEELEALDIPVMLSVTNAKSGEVELLVGEEALAFTDRNLVSKLARATRRSAT